MRRLALVGVTALVTCCASAARAETIADVEKKLADMIGKYKSLAYRMKTSTEMKIDDFQMKTESDGTFEVARRDTKWMSRMEAKTNTERKPKDGKEEKDSGRILQIYDGEFSWTLSESDDQKSAMKMKPEKGQMISPFDVKAMFEMLHREFNLKLLSDEKIAGKDVWAIEATPKEKAAHEGMGRSVSYYQKDTGILLKGVTYDKAGKPVSTSTFSEVRVNPNIPAERFAFKPPPGVEVMDMSKMSGPDTAPAQREPEAGSEQPKRNDSPPPAKEEPAQPKKTGVGGLLNKIKPR